MSNELNIHVIDCDDVCQSECVRTHNAYRLNYGVPPLLFNRQLAKQAQTQIDKGILAHSDWVKTKGGENIAWGSIFPTFISAIKSWHDEKSHFDFETGKSKGENHVIRNFIQLVWKGASKIGCARGTLYGKPWYIVHYDKAPNMDDPDAVQENIGKPKEEDVNWFRDSSPFAKDFENPTTV
ncbi:Golgi-associated plant pathogenesis-related protein 1 [Exaiptasia diaphana]|uniref:SCP domain-containing protein n=1 Tax=Exaiptasia diaphana TaxID=2652724 RepID=A0A913XHA7_EXADI|nr:Golgi-associated plant pathogenesis-related protein 1 [Exaiptasia diaphana]